MVTTSVPLRHTMAFTVMGFLRSCESPMHLGLIVRRPKERLTNSSRSVLGAGQQSSIAKTATARPERALPQINNLSLIGNYRLGLAHPATTSPASSRGIAASRAVSLGRIVQSVPDTWPFDGRTVPSP